MRPFLKRAHIGTLLTSALFISSFASRGLAQVAVTTSHNDNARTGLNSAESKLNVANLNAARFGKLFSRTVDAKIWCQPLYVPGVVIAGKGTHNVVYVVSELGTVYAFDADDAAQSTPLWKTSLLAANPTNGLADQNVSSPVIDRGSNTIFLTGKSNSGGWNFRIFALDIRSGAKKTGSGQVISTVVNGNAKGSANGRLTFNAQTQKQRPALLLQGGKIFAAFGGSVDEFDPYVAWNGWIFVFDAATLRQEQVLAVAPNGNGGGIWQAGNGMSVDAQGNVYAITGNGNGYGKDGTGELYSFSADKGGFDYGNSIIKLSVGTPVGTKPGSVDYGGKRLNVVDYWTPYNWKYIETADQDLGSSGVLQIPGTPYMVTGDKIGRFYTLDSRNLGKFQASSNSQIVNDFQAWKGNLHGGMVYYPGTKYGPVIYGWSENDVLKCFRVSDVTTRGAKITPVMTSTATAPPGMPGGFLSVSSNGTQSGSAVIWAYTPYEGDANQFIVPGILRAFDADNLSRELWNSKMVASRDDTGLFSKFSNPTVANGKVYLSSFSNRLNVYGLLPATTPPTAPLNLKATAGIQKVSLAWSTVSGATSYTLKRSSSSNGPFTTIAENLTSASYADLAVVAGQTYFYVVSASNSGGEGPNSGPASAKPFNPAAGTVLSLDFNGSSPYFGPVTAMEAGEVAGVVAVPNWNVLNGNIGSKSNLTLNGGVASGASVSWNSEVAVSTVIPDTAGNNRMMKGYLSNDSSKPITISVKSLPTAIVNATYDVYVYCDGVNPTATRAAKFTIGSQTLQTSDARNRDFEGRFFEPGIANIGNTLIFKDLKAASFDLLVNQGPSDDTTPRDPINGFQIVAHQKATETVTPAPKNLAASANYNQVFLTWNSVASATLYTVKRAGNPAGPFVAIGTSTTAEFVDVNAKNGVTYFYVVTATIGTKESLPSNKVAATPLAGYSGRTINIDFGGATTAAQPAANMVGYIVRNNWNNASGLSGSQNALVDDKGVATTAALAWKASSTGDLPINDTAGNPRMMRGYIAGSQTPATVSISNIPSDFLSNGYDVYVYGDSNNPGNRTARYSVGNRNFTLTDTAGTQFGQYFIPGNNTSGNVVVLPMQKANSFTLSANGLTSADGTITAPINGIQIVARNASPVSGSAPVSISVSPTPLSSVYGNATYLNSVYADADGANTIATAYLHVGTSATDTTGMDAYYNAITNKLFVYDGTKWIGDFAPGSANVIKGPRGWLNCSKTLITRSGTTLTVTWNITPLQGLVGTKNIFGRVQDQSNLSDQWKNLGSWTIKASSATFNSASQSSQSF